MVLKERRTGTTMRPFCGDMKTQLSRHMKIVHQNEMEIKNYNSTRHQKKLAELAKLRNKGIAEFNVKMAHKGSANFIFTKKGKNLSGPPLLCQICNKCLTKRYFAAHKCVSDEKQRVAITATEKSRKGTEFAEKVLPFFRKNTSEILEGKVILAIGLNDYTPIGETEKYTEERSRTTKKLDYLRISTANSGKRQEMEKLLQQ